MMNPMCYVQYGYSQALAVPQVTSTHCGLRYCSHLYVLAWEKTQDLEIFRLYFSDLGIMCFEERLKLREDLTSSVSRRSME